MIPRGVTVGIDIGSEFSRIAFWNPKTRDVVVLHEVRSYVEVKADGEVGAIGEEALKIARHSPFKVVFDMKSLLGRHLGDRHLTERLEGGIGDEGSSMFEKWPFSLDEVRGKLSFVAILGGDGETSDGASGSGEPAQEGGERGEGRCKVLVEAAVGALVKELVVGANKKLASIDSHDGGDGGGEETEPPKVQQAVVAVPAWWGEEQREAMKRAVQNYGNVPVIQFLGEPAAAGMAFRLERFEGSRIVLVVSVGAGSIDATVLETEDGVCETLAAAGDPTAGMRDLHSRILERCWTDAAAEARHCSDPASIPRLPKSSWAQLQEDASAALKAVGSDKEAEAEVSMPTRLLSGDAGDSKRLLTSTMLKEAATHLEGRLIHVIRRALADAGHKGHEVDDLLLVGGGAHLRIVQRVIACAVDRVPYPPPPLPQEAVVSGAAMQGAIRAGVDNGLLLRVDVAPFSIGIGINGEVFSPIVVAGNRVPCRSTGRFVTVEDGQEEIRCRVYSGERFLLRDCDKWEKEFTVTVPPGPAGKEGINVMFDVDADFRLRITADVLSTKARVGPIFVSEPTMPTREKIEAWKEARDANREKDERSREIYRKILEVKKKARELRSTLEKEDLTPEKKSEIQAVVDDAIAFVKRECKPEYDGTDKGSQAATKIENLEKHMKDLCKK